MYGANYYGQIYYGQSYASGNAYTRLFEEVATLTSTFVKSPAKIWAELQTLSEVITKARSAFTTKLETLTLSSVFARVITAIKLETATISEVFGTIQKRFFVWIDSFTLTDDIDSSQARGLEYLDDMLLTEEYQRSATRDIVEELTLSEIFGSIKNQFFTLVDSFTGFIEEIFLGQQKNKNVTDDIYPTDNIVKSTTKTPIEAISLSEVFSNIKGFISNLLDTSTLSDNFNKIRGRTFIELLSLFERAKKYLNGNIVVRYLYILKNTLFSNKYTAKGNTYTDKLSSKNTVYSEKYQEKETDY